MKVIRALDDPYQQDSANFIAIGNGIYQSRHDQRARNIEAGDYLITLLFEFEDEKDKQTLRFIVEDLMDRTEHANLYAPDEVFSEDGRSVAITFGGQSWGEPQGDPDALANIQGLQALVGKRVFYTPVMENGKEYLHLTIE